MTSALKKTTPKLAVVRGTAKVSPEAAFEDITRLIGNAVDRSGTDTDYDQITDAYIEEVQGNRLRKRHAHYLMRRGIIGVMADARYQQRRALKRSACSVDPALGEQAEQAEAHAATVKAESSGRTRGNVRDIVDDHAGTVLCEWILDNGIALGDASVSYLRELAEGENANAEGHGKNAMFYTRLADMVPANAEGPLKDHLTVEQVDAVRREVYGDDAA